MFKKIDKLISLAFFGPFFLTFFIVLFILLTVFVSKYFEDLVGKDLGLEVYLEFIFYFALNQTVLALPLAVLLSSLMAYGNLGEHYEITAIKSAGISMVRTLLPIAFYAFLISLGAFVFNNRIVPYANLKAFRLLYDIRHKKPALDLKEGGFYNGLVGYSIRVEKKSKTSNDLYGLMIYNHTANRGNTELIMADTGKMYMIYDNTYLVMELGGGYAFSEVVSYTNPKPQFRRDNFSSAKFVFPLESFNLQNTDEDLFKTNRIMKNSSQLKYDADSMSIEARKMGKSIAEMTRPYFDYKFSEYKFRDEQFRDTVSENFRDLKKIYSEQERDIILERALNKVRNLKNLAEGNRQRVEDVYKSIREHLLEYHRKYALSVACFLFFLIGAPLGAIIKKGGLGVPVLISITFFLAFYFMTITGDKYGREGKVDIIFGAWIADLVLLGFGIWFLRQAHRDSRLLESDAYLVFFDKVKFFIQNKFKKKA